MTERLSPSWDSQPEAAYEDFVESGGFSTRPVARPEPAERKTVIRERWKPGLPGGCRACRKSESGACPDHEDEHESYDLLKSIGSLK